VNTDDTDPGNPSRLNKPGPGKEPLDLLPGQPQAPELELDAYGVPVQHRLANGRTYLLVAGCLICGGVSAGLAVMGHWLRLPEYLAYLGMGLAALVLVPLHLLHLNDKEKRKQLGRVTVAIAEAGCILALLALIVLSSYTDNGLG
jgi:hypothetical protein